MTLRDLDRFDWAAIAAGVFAVAAVALGVLAARRDRSGPGPHGYPKDLK